MFRTKSSSFSKLRSTQDVAVEQKRGLAESADQKRSGSHARRDDRRHTPHTGGADAAVRRRPDILAGGGFHQTRLVHIHPGQHDAVDHVACGFKLADGRSDRIELRAGCDRREGRIERLRRREHTGDRVVEKIIFLAQLDRVHQPRVDPQLQLRHIRERLDRWPL